MINLLTQKLSLEMTRKKKLALLGVGAAVLTVSLGGYAFSRGVSGGESGLTQELAKRFPNTKISAVNCDVKLAGLCEVVAGQNVFYASRDGKLAFVGAVLDTEKKIDLTDKRLRELAAVGNFEGRLSGQGAAPAQPSQPAAQAAAPEAPAGPLKVSLPVSNAIVHNPGAALKLTIFTDLNCGYCHKLWEDLKSAPDIEVTEYPIAFLAADSKDKAKLALCAKDRVKAVAAIYGGGELTSPGNCDAAEGAVDANTKFAQEHQITGTPTIVRADGQRISGWKPLADLRNFAKGA